MMNLNLALLCGIDIPIQSCCLTAHQPSIKELAYIGTDSFFSALQLLSINKFILKNMDENALSQLSNFQIFMKIKDREDMTDAKENLILLLQLVFPNYKIIWMPRSIIFKNETENILIDDNNFDDFQSILTQIFCLSSSFDVEKKSFNPGGIKAEEIAQKLMKARERVAAQKENTNGSGTIIDNYLSILSVGLSISINELSKMTIFQLYNLIERFSLYTSWNLEIRAKLAGAKIDGEPTNWIKNII